MHDELVALESRDYVTNDDGTYEIYLIPGTYDILLDKDAYLDCIFISQLLTEGATIDLGNKTLLAGDIDNNGIVNALDIAKIKSFYGMHSTDAGINEAHDFNMDTIINALDIAYVKSNYSKTREIN